MTVPKYRFIQGHARKVFFFLIQDTRVNFYVRRTLQESGANSMKNAVRVRKRKTRHLDRNVFIIYFIRMFFFINTNKKLKKRLTFIKMKQKE